MDEARHQELGPYRLDVLIGRSDTGDVYKAWDGRLERWVAVKHLGAAGNGNGHGNGAARAHFRREAKVIAGVAHPAIVRIFDILEENGNDWIVMELIDGPDLATLLGDGPLVPDLAVDYGRQVAAGLGAVHDAGVVHRDLRTECVMVVPAAASGQAPGVQITPGIVKIVDFGFAKRAQGTDDNTSLTGSMPGSPRALAPEQVLGQKVDARADLFALGVLLYELLTARSPFAARTMVDTARRILEHAQPSVRRINQQIPAALSDLVDKLLEKDPAERPQNAGQVFEGLQEIASQSPRFNVLKNLELLPGSNRETLAMPILRPAAEAQVKTLLVSDLVGSTKLMEKLGDHAAAALFQRHDRRARDLLVHYGGLEIDKTDGFLLLFDRPWNAVAYALAYHQELRQLSEEEEVLLASRVGIHLGGVILLRNTPTDVARGAKPVEVEGLAKPTTARLMSLADGGQTLLTRTAYDAAQRSSTSEEETQALHWLCHGSYRFKGIEDDFEIFEVGHAGIAPLAAPPGTEKVRRVDSEGEAPGVSENVIPVVLHSWPPPELPEQPYPVLLPYTHPALLAGREQEIDKLRLQLRMPVPILGLGAPSGTGKSSLLLGGLVPALRAAGSSVALVRHPQEPGLAGRLLGDLLDGIGDDIADSDWRGFVDRLAEVERLAGEAPLLVLDQFEDVLRGDNAAARARLGVLMAATVQRRPGIDEPPCRWLLAYRNEYHGEVLAWLEDVLQEVTQAPPGFSPAVLPHDLSTPERFQSLTLTPLATPPPTGDPLAEATRVFQAAIEKPLRARGPDGAERYSLRFAPGHAERLARTFAEARLRRPSSPLVPELQVVLAHLLDRAAPDGTVTVPDDPGDLVEEALADHLRRALEAAFPATDPRDTRAATRRARALLALRELATVSGSRATAGQRDEGVPAEELAKAIGEDGEHVLEQLATPLTRLVVLQDSPEGLRCVLSHDRMAEVVVRMVEEEGRQGKLLVDAELLALRGFVAVKTALYQAERASGVATRILRRHYTRIAAHADALLPDDGRRAWWAACRRRRRADFRRSAVRGVAARQGDAKADAVVEVHRPT